MYYLYFSIFCLIASLSSTNGQEYNDNFRNSPAPRMNMGLPSAQAHAPQQRQVANNNMPKKTH